MEVRVKPEVQAKLDQMARESARPSDEYALIGYFDELAYTREMLDRRYDDLESGKVKLISPEEVRARILAKSAARRAEHS
jgi:hypothetical protein